MKPGIVRPLSIAVIRRGDAIFVVEGHDRRKQQTFYRPLGGQIEFGEHSRETLQREMREEIGQEVRDLRYLGTLENIFVYEGQQGHEIVIVYAADFVDREIYTRDWVTGREDNGATFKALWKPLRDFNASRAPLYPDGLLELIEAAGSSSGEAHSWSGQ